MSDRVLDRPVPEALEAAEAFRRLMHGEAEPDEELLEDGIAFAGVARYPVRVKCALLGWMAFRDAAARALAGQVEASETVYGEDGEDADAVRAAKAQRLPGERD